MMGRFRGRRIARLMPLRARRARLWGRQRARGMGRAGRGQAGYDTTGDYYHTGREEEIGAELRRRQQSSGPSTEFQGTQQSSGASTESLIIRPSESPDY
jgi:hypothetical protein